MPVAALFALLAACQQETTPVTRAPITRGDAPEFTPSEPVLRRLTTAQYVNAMRDLFGDEIVLPASLEPDAEVEGLFAVGASMSTISPLGVEQYEGAAFDIAEQVMEDEALVERWRPCTPLGPADADCAELALSTLGRFAWRRPLTAGEVETLSAIALAAAEIYDDFDDGLVFGYAALLQSPHFLYRVETGEPTEAGEELRYTDWEMASRLSFLLWDSIPDAELLDAAEAGELVTDAGLQSQLERMLDQPTAENGLRNFFTEMLGLHELDDLSKDPNVFVHASDTLGPAAREETLLSIDALVWDDDGDLRELFTSRRTFVDRELAALYRVQAPAEEGFGEVWLPEDGGRAGLLGQASVLALHAHPVSTSVTRRGVFVRQSLLCQAIGSPPADIDAAIPEASEDLPTMRERVAVHLEDPVCAACHSITDPIGLGLENFDGMGGWRTTENDVTIDASGELDGRAFADAVELGQALAEHSALPACVVEKLYAYATGSLVTADDITLVNWHEEGFAESDFRMLAMVEDIALSPGFRTLRAPADTRRQRD